MEMLLETGFCQNENYAPLGRPCSGDTPATLIDYFPDDFVTVIDESHMTVPQLRAMYGRQVEGGPGAVRVQTAVRPGQPAVDL